MKRRGVITSVVCAVILCGCASPRPVERSEAVQIEVLGFGDCPNTPPFRQRVETAAGQVGGFTVVSVDQESLPQADLRRGYPAPTALVDGRDLFGLPTPTAPSLGCRMYPGGLPSVDEIVERLRAAQRP